MEDSVVRKDICDRLLGDRDHGARSSTRDGKRSVRAVVIHY